MGRAPRRAAPVPSLILSALLSAPLDCISASMHLPVVRNGRELESRYARESAVACSKPTAFSSFLSLSLSLARSVFSFQYHRVRVCIYISISDAENGRQAFSLARGENEGTDRRARVASTSRASSQLRESISRSDEAKRCACCLTRRKQPCISLQNRWRFI